MIKFIHFNTCFSCNASLYNIRNLNLHGSQVVDRKSDIDYSIYIQILLLLILIVIKINDNIGLYNSTLYKIVTKKMI